MSSCGATNAKVEAMRRGVQEMEAERDAHRHELANMRAELEREKVLRRAAEDALAAKGDPRNEEARKRGLVTGARVRIGNVRGVIAGWDEDGDPSVTWHGPISGEQRVDFNARDVELDTEATT